MTALVEMDGGLQRRWFACVGRAGCRIDSGAGAKVDGNGVAAGSRTIGNQEEMPVLTAMQALYLLGRKPIPANLLNTQTFMLTMGIKSGKSIASNSSALGEPGEHGEEW